MDRDQQFARGLQSHAGGKAVGVAVDSLVPARGKVDPQRPSRSMYTPQGSLNITC